ncbi:MAG: 50S ribosomal protein L24 [Mollicutes bacterium]|nr:MAG: 50S ribosomal protein L24 [Mollicutes bacterium]
MKIKKGDKVQVITGKHKKTEGLVVEIDLKKQRVMLEEIKRKKHQKAKQSEESGQIIEVYAPVPVSNVMLVDSKSNTGRTRVGYKIIKNKKVRFSKKTGKIYDK